MQAQNFLDQTFKQLNFQTHPLSKGSYDHCEFINCNFSECHLSGITFLECTFIDCNLSGVNVNDVTFNDVVFKHCKMLGINFMVCNRFLLSFQFDHCKLNNSIFSKLSMPHTTFNHCELHYVDFVETHLQNSQFIHSDLSAAIFENTNLSQCDFRSAINYQIKPDQNQLKAALFSKHNLEGLLSAFPIKIQ